MAAKAAGAKTFIDINAALGPILSALIQQLDALCLDLGERPLPALDAQLLARMTAG